ncbi:MAG: helix-turn-helix transcriptional regulator [bacterium]|nr:helix-turn-helix transcriptional regulator [bacterium]
MLHPTRLELLEHLDEPRSAADLARELGLPRQRINYHLRELEAQSLIERVEEKRRGRSIGRTYRRTGRAYAISTAALGALGTTPEEAMDRFSSAHQIALASRAVRDLAELQAGARAAGKKLPAFASELADALAALTAKYHDEKAPRGRTFRFFLGAHPKPKGK